MSRRDRRRNLQRPVTNAAGPVEPFQTGGVPADLAQASSGPASIPATALDRTPLAPQPSQFQSYQATPFGGIADRPNGAGTPPGAYQTPPALTDIDRDRLNGPPFGINAASTQDDFNSWRYLFNPLYGATMQLVIETIQTTMLGMWADATWFSKLMVERDDVLTALVTRRVGALAAMQIDHRAIEDDMLPDGSTPEDAQAQVKALKRGYSLIQNMPEAIEALCMATFNHHQHLEKIYTPTPGGYAITRLDPVDPWHWKQRSPYYPWLYDPAAMQSMAGYEADMRRFVVRVVKRHTLFLSMIYFMRKTYAMKTWDQFLAIYGIPTPFVTKPDPKEYPEQSKDTQNAFWLNATAQARYNGGVFPFGTEVDFPTAVRSDANPFLQKIEALEERLILSGTCGRFTMLQGVGTLGGHGGEADAHQQSFEDIGAIDAADISMIFQQQLDQDILDLAGFAGQPCLAKTWLLHNEAKNSADATDEILKLFQAGLEVAPDQVEKDTGYKVTRIQQNSLTPGAAGGSGGARQEPGAVDNSNESTTNAYADDAGILSAQDLYALGASLDLAPLRNTLKTIRNTTAPDQLGAKIYDACHDFLKGLKPGHGADALRNAMVKSFCGAIRKAGGARA